MQIIATDKADLWKTQTSGRKVLLVVFFFFMNIAADA
jgi:hypothetical protein